MIGDIDLKQARGHSGLWKVVQSLTKNGFKSISFLYSENQSPHISSSHYLQNNRSRFLYYRICVANTDLLSQGALAWRVLRAAN